MRIVQAILLTLVTMCLSAQYTKQKTSTVLEVEHYRLADKALLKGAITDFSFNTPHLNNACRMVRVYTPPNYSTDQLYPVLYMHDGQNIFYDSTSFVGEWFVDEIMDSLYQSVGFECIVVAIDHMGVDRMREYNPWDNERFGKGLGKAYLDWIVEEVKPFIDRNFSTQSDPQYTAMMGASLGGTITHYAMLKYPGIFGKGGIYSPSYWISNKELRMMTSNYSSDQALKAVVLMGKEGWGNVRKAKKQAALLHKNDIITIQFIRDKKGRHNEKMWSKHFADTMLYLLQ